MYHLMDGSQNALERLLKMRENCAFYCELLDHYAPAVVTTWNCDENMKAFCTTNDTRAFAKHVLSVSDEAFIILVLVNSSPRWMAEIIRAEKQADGYVVAGILQIVCWMMILTVVAYMSGRRSVDG